MCDMSHNLFCFISSTHVAASGTELMSAYSVRITMISDGQEYEWEYDSPGKYEFEKGSSVMKGKEAKEQVEAIVSQLQITEKRSIEQYVEKMKEKFPQMSKLDIRYMNKEGELFTWVWPQGE